MQSMYRNDFSCENTGKEKRDKHTCAGALIIIKLLSFADISQIRYHSDFLQYQQAASLSLKPSQRQKKKKPQRTQCLKKPLYSLILSSLLKIGAPSQIVGSAPQLHVNEFVFFQGQEGILILKPDSMRSETTENVSIYSFAATKQSKSGEENRVIRFKFSK